MKNREDLKSQWVNLVSKYSDDEKLIGDIFNSIKKYYNSPNRYYHNLDHIEKMLLEAKKFKEKVDDYDSMLFAIWFHDIIYNTKKSDNEEKSAEYAENFLSEIKYNPEKIIEITRMILKTKNHQVDEMSESDDTKLFLDLDLLILGVETDIYWRYVEAIRKEYEFIPDVIFYAERSKILTKLLNQKRILKSKQLKVRYEETAKRNIQSELNLLIMQKSFQKWLKTSEYSNNYDYIEKKLIEIANEYNFNLYHRIDTLAEDKVVLAFFNKDIQKFLTAWVNEKGFSHRLYDDLL